MIVHEKDRTRVLSVTDGPTLATAESPPTHLLLDSTGEGIYAVNTQGLCTFVNRSAAEMLGYGPRDLIGRNLHDLIHHSRDDGSPYPEEECPIYPAFRAGRGVTVEGEPFWRRDGTSFPTRYSSFPVVDGGEVTGAVVTFSDITERSWTGTHSARRTTNSSVVSRSGLPSSPRLTSGLSPRSPSASGRRRSGGGFWISSSRRGPA